MKTIIAIAGLCLATFVGAHAAQLYRWVDSKGNVEWRDTPPPASAPAKQVEQRRVTGGGGEGGELPYSMQLAAKNHPVTLWTTADCGQICEGARAHLTRRGVPYTDKPPQSDVEAFKKLSPGNEVPILQVGVITLKGYLDSAWDTTLDAAGYPRTVLPVRPKPAATAPAPPSAPSK